MDFHGRVTDLVRTGLLYTVTAVQVGPRLVPDTIDGKVVLLCRQVDAIAVACSDHTVAQDWVDSIKGSGPIKSQGILSSFNGIDVDQRREYVKIPCQSYLTHVC
jgi:hypothetical protein